MYKVITIIGTRPETIRLSRIINLLDKKYIHKLVHTNQNFDYELNEIFFKELRIRKPDFFFKECKMSTCKIISKIILGVDKILTAEKPDAVLILGDTNSALASAIVSKKKKIPIFHIEAGNRSYDLRVPEEINRKIIDHISDVNLSYSDIARNNLIKESYPSDRVIKVGSPLKEVLDYYKPQIKSSNILNKLNLNKGKFFLVSVHREENINSKKLFRKLENILNDIADKYNLPVIISAHPRTRYKFDKKNIKFHSLVRIFKPFSFIDYIHLQMAAKCVLSDSGSITEESSILNFPALNIRETNERQEGMEEGAVMMVGMDIEKIIHALEILKDQTKNKISNRLLKIVDDYNVSNVSEKITRIIASYIDYVNREVWKKD